MSIRTFTIIIIGLLVAGAIGTCVFATTQGTTPDDKTKLAAVCATFVTSLLTGLISLFVAYRSTEVERVKAQLNQDLEKFKSGLTASIEEAKSQLSINASIAITKALNQIKGSDELAEAAGYYYYILERATTGKVTTTLLLQAEDKMISAQRHINKENTAEYNSFLGFWNHARSINDQYKNAIANPPALRAIWEEEASALGGRLDDFKAVISKRVEAIGH